MRGLPCGGSFVPEKLLQREAPLRVDHPRVVAIGAQPIAEYARLKETLDVLSDPVLMKQIGRSQTFFKAGKKGLSFEDVFGEPFTPAKKRRTA